MDDVDVAIVEAWDRVKLFLARDPAECRKRLARQQQITLRKTPRARCLAIRANDLRIDGTVPDDGAQHKRHDVWLYAEDIWELCAPVEITPPGETFQEVAARLGVTANGLRQARLAGRFHTHHVAGLGGCWGKPVPLIYTEQQLDPASACFAPADPVWGWLTRDLYRKIPDDFQQTITRVPCFWPRGCRYAEDVLDVGDSTRPPRKRDSRKLPPPEPDYVPYKWKDGEFLGYDWRNPLAKENYERHQRRLAQNRASRAKRRRERPPASRGSGSILFRGWRWLCPVCQRPANRVFCPLPAISKLHYDLTYHGDMLPTWFVEQALASLAAEQSQPLRFGCGPCSGVTYMSLSTSTGWNQLISYLTRGLLRGPEVPRPQCAAGQRKILYAPRRPRSSSPANLRRRAHACKRLMEGWTSARIAAELEVSLATVTEHVKRLYRQHGVRGRYELAARLGAPLQRPPLLCDQVYARLAAGASYAQIAADLNIPRRRVAMYAWRYRRKAVPRDACPAVAAVSQRS